MAFIESKGCFNQYDYNLDDASKITYFSDLKIAAADMRYFARSKHSKSLVHKKIFSLVCQVDFKLGYLFCQ